LIELLSKGKRYLSIHDIAKELKVTERTVYRDFESLEILGFPVINDRGYKIYISPGLTVNQLTESDCLTIETILNTSPFMRLPNMQARCDSLLAKLKTHISTQSIDITPPESYQPADKFPTSKFNFNIRQLDKAVQREKIIKILYHAINEDQPVSRNVHPYVIAVRKSNWYLIGFSERSQDIHMYRLERIHDIQVTHQSFKRTESFDLDEYFHSVWGAFRGENVRVELHLKGLAVRLVQDQPWSEQTGFTEQNDGSLIVKTEVQGTDELLGWVLSQSPNVEILQPESLRNELKTALKKMLKLHS
jgi:predicted DNA-binding transcriptional regulator YafY